MAKMTNTFAQGMDQDSSKNKYDNRHYYEAENVRIFSQDGLSGGALEDIKGTMERIDLSPLYPGNESDIKVVGYCVLRENIIMFVALEGTGPPDYCAIIQISIATLEGLTGENVYPVDINYVHNGGDIIYKEYLGFSTEYPIQCVGRYENEYVQKIYWVDGNNLLRYMNIVYDAELNDLENLPVSYLEVIGDIELTRPVIQEPISGSLRAGRISYVYQLYIANGSQTIFSPESALMNITSADYEAVDSNDFYGDILDTSSGKGFKGLINVDSDYYTRCRIIAIHYNDEISEPEIRIVEEIDISTDPSGNRYVIFLDIGQTIGTLTLEEVRILSTSLFSAQTIETKDNILFAGNIVEDAFDVDFDARAYRFGGDPAVDGTDVHNDTYNPSAPPNDIQSHGVSLLWEGDGINYYKIDAATKATTLEPAGTSIGDWEDIPEDADCINTFNDIDNDQSKWHRLRYKTDLETFGGEGPNVSFKFVTHTTDVDILSDTFFTVYEIETGRNDTTEIEGVTNWSYHDYASPFMAGNLVGYQRDDVYRFGIVFFDTKGRNSFVKWICDIRFPSMTSVGEVTDDYVLSQVNGSTVEGNLLGIEFTVDTSSIDSEIEGYQIVRVKRHETDKNILAQGMVNEAVSGRFRTALVDAVNFCFQSPEVCFRNNISAQEGDQLHVVGYPGLVDDTFVPNAFYALPTRYNTWTQVLPPDEYFGIFTTAGVLDAGLMTQDSVEITVNGIAYPVANATTECDKGRNLIVATDNPVYFWIPSDEVYTAKHLINYRRRKFESQYGGNTYSARRNNEYIVASRYILKTEVTAHDVYGGDTYIAMFEYMYNARTEGSEIDITTGEECNLDVVHFVGESTINVKYRGEGTYSQNTSPYLLHDLAGFHTIELKSSGGTETQSFFQENDLYVYNEAYSRDGDARIFITKPFDWKERTGFDVRTYASLVKINGEATDSWLRFPVNQFIEVDPQHGPLTALKTVNEKLLFFQTQAFGVLSVNERALLETTDISQLSLGVSGVLTRYDYSKTDIGCSHWRHVMLTPNSLYWADALDKAMYKYGSGPEEVSLMKGMDSWFRTNMDNTGAGIDDGMHMWYNPEFREVCLTDTTNNWTILYNEITDSFITFMSIQPNIVMNYLDKTIGIDMSAPQTIHRHDDFAGQRGQFYDTWSDLSVTLLLNPHPDNIAVYNNFEWLTESFNIDPVSGLQDRPFTFTELQMWNDYQNTGPLTLTVGDNVKRRMRKWRHTLPRARYNRQGNITLTERYARMRDSHMFAKFTYSPDETDDKMFIMHDIINSHTISNS
jgi:hypothetical protein